MANSTPRAGTLNPNGHRGRRALGERTQRGCAAVRGRAFPDQQPWLGSAWCKNELNLARRLNKRLFGILIEERLAVGDLPADVTSKWQVINLAAGSDHQQFPVTLPVAGELATPTFSREGLGRLKSGLHAGLAASWFARPPVGLSCLVLCRDRSLRCAGPLRAPVLPICLHNMRVLMRRSSGIRRAWELHLKGRALPKRRFHPNAAAMHFNDLLGNGEAEAGPTLGLGVGTVHLMELIEDASLVLFGNAWSRIGHADVEVAVDRLGGHAHLAGVRELDGVAHEVEQH